jgi:hypothetical protein
MKKLLILLLLGCSIRPSIEPFGCTNGTPTCVCNDQGCEWIWICEN